ncbi:nitrogen fixation protein NifQ [Malonomonas rubra DSM 5091]|uniref:Nitrogen fixation protein NifQ n=2 Tax=Malonomonas rubra TaxID=57040 RepID=A0A1M6N383_MALRU|nr:nitrogen fixation protein NifQ [Malonomonas rubra DSM 5091]
MQGYTEKIRKYAADETHIGLLDKPDGTGEVGLRDQDKGNRLAVRFTLKLDNELIKKIRYQVFGCGFTIAACAAIAELSEGHSLQESIQCTPDLINRKLGGLPEERNYCAELAAQAFQAAVNSARNGAKPVAAEIQPEAEEDLNPRVNRRDPFYRALLDTDIPPGIFYEDRQMFAGLLTLAKQEGGIMTNRLGLKSTDVDKILAIYFPGFDRRKVTSSEPQPKQTPPPGINPDVLSILLSHVPCDQAGRKAHLAELLAKAIACRAALPGHLWVSMGLLKRPQLTAAIRRHLPTLALANNKGMRWKRYLFKQACDMNGGVMCKSPNCADCSDYHLCFAPENA